jgi:hypothetical protein
MRAARRCLLVVCAALAAAAGVPGAAAANVRSATDHAAGVRFTLDGRALTLRLVPQAGHKPPDARRKLWGHRLRASCGHSGPAGNPLVAGLTFIPFRWPRGTLTRKVHLSRDVSASPGWCIVEAVSDGGDIAAVNFKVRPKPVE